MMRVPFPYDADAFVFKVNPLDEIIELMEICEDQFCILSKLDAKNKSGYDLAINVVWNTKDHKVSLNPRAPIGAHFADGETFGVYGDIVDAEDYSDIPECDKIPVTILTGFLGSGKTTLLNYILQEQQDMKIAVIENEFGEVAIDDEILKQKKYAMAEKIITMDNGCMCCTIRGDLLVGLKTLMDGIKKGSGIQQIIIETTGMADPVPIVWTFMTNPDLTDHLRLDGVVALVDAKHLPGRLDDDIEGHKVNEAYQQIAFCDRIVLNKLDLVSTEDAISVKDRIRAINKFAKVIPAVRGRIKVSTITNMHAHDMKNFGVADITVAEDTDLTDIHSGGHGDGHGGGHGDGHRGGHGDNHEVGHGDGHGEGFGHGEEGHSGHSAHGATGHVNGHGQNGISRHDNRVNSFSIVRKGIVHPQLLQAWIQNVTRLPATYGTLFRIKAILAMKDHSYKYVLHSVMDVLDFDEGDAWEENEEKICKIVFIGKSMDQKFIRDGFNDIFV